MSKRDDRVYLQHIRDAIAAIDDYCHGMDQAAFSADHKTQDAVMRNLTVAGEAANKITAEFRRMHPEVPWQKMIGLRNVLVHRYFGVNLTIVWETVTEELPELAVHVSRLLQE